MFGSCTLIDCRVALKNRFNTSVRWNHEEVRSPWISLLLACAVSLNLLAPVCPAQTSTDGREKFADVAAKLRAFPPDGMFFAEEDYMHQMHVFGPRMDMRVDVAFGKPATPGTPEYHALINADYPVPFLLSLLKDKDARVRTLAAGALVAKGDPRLQHDLAPLVHDASPTFDVITTLPTDNFTPSRFTPQTVSGAVLRLVEMPSASDFDQYWAVHANHDYCASWFLWQFLHPPFASVAREQIQRLPSPDRELTILWIGAGTSNRLDQKFTGYSGQELLDAARQLKREDVLQALRGDPSVSDPDLRAAGLDSALAMNSSTYGHASELGNFLLTHAKDLLTEADAKTLLELGTSKNPRIAASPELWFIAAANLYPQEADSILDVAELLWPSAGDVQLARWDVYGESMLPKILNRFYRSPEAQEALARSIPDGSYQPLVEAILASDRHLQIDGKAMGSFGSLNASGWKGKFDDQIIDWIFAQPPDPDIGIAGPSREMVVSFSGVVRKLVLDPRFDKADGQLLYVVEQGLVGNLKLNHAESVRLDRLIEQLYSQQPKPYPEPVLQETRDILRQGVSNKE